MPKGKTAVALGLVFNPDGYEGELLHSAAIYDQHVLLTELLHGGMNGTVKSTDNYGRTALHTAASHGSLKCVKVLLQRGADPNASSGIEDKCFTPVHHAAQKAHITCLAALLEYEANLDIKNSQGKKAIDIAIDGGQPEFIKCVEYINRVKEQREKDREIAKCEELYDVIDDGSFERAKQLLESMCDPYSIVNLHYRGPHTLLYRASIGGFIDIVKLLIDYQADGRPNRDSGLTPLYGACFAGHPDVVIYLSQKFPQQLDMPVTVDETYPLHAAVMKDHIEIVRYLLKLRQTEQTLSSGESPRERNGGKFVSSRKSTNSLPAMEEEYKRTFVDVNKPMKAGNYTPLHLAVLYSNIEIVKALLSCTPAVRSSANCPLGSLIIDEPANHKTAFHHALFLGKVEIAELLLINGNDINQTFDDAAGFECTPFKYACAYSSEEMLKMLIRNGAYDLDHTGLGEAVRFKREKIIRILLSNGVSQDGEGKVVIAASELSLDLKPVLVNWSDRRLPFINHQWLFNAGLLCNLHAEEKLINDPGLKLKTFTTIILSNNELESLPVVLFQLPSLKKMDLSNNKLTSLPGTSERSAEPAIYNDNWNCPSLEELELHHNLLKNPPKILFAMPVLQMINLGWNEVVSLPFDMWVAPRLKILILVHNCLKELPCFSDDSGRFKPVNPDRKGGRSKSIPSRNINPVTVNNVKKPDFATTSQVYSKRPTWDGHSDDSDDDDVDYLNKSGLNKLDLSENQFTQITVGLPCLAPNLSKLFLQKNKITEIDSVTLLPYSLTQLDLSDNGLKKFDLSLPKTDDVNICYAPVRKSISSRPLSYPNSKQKFCMHCKHRQLSELSTLILSDNQLENIPLSQPIARGLIDDQKILFPELKTLVLSRNKLSKIPMFIGRLTKLGSLSIDHNTSIDTLPSELGLCSELYELKIERLSIRDPAKNVVDKRRNDGSRDIRYLTGYLRSLHDKAQVYPNIKLMIVGVHGIGKTTLLECLRKDGTGTYQQSEYKSHFSERRANEKLKKTSSTHSTVGVDISDWKLKRYARGEVKFSTWDFGGQTEYYATHQCFLSRRALYLLLWKLTDRIPALKAMEQWLLNIQERAPNSSVIIVGTFLDEVDKKNREQHVKEMQDEIRKRYMSVKNGGGVMKPAEKGLPNVAAMVEVSCKADTNISKLRDLIFDTVVNLKAEGKDGNRLLLEKKIPASYIAVEKAVTTIAENLKNEIPVLEEPQFRAQVTELLNKQGAELRNGDEELDQAVQFLHDYGIMLHYDDPALRNLYFVDPQWLCDMLAHVVTVKCVNPCIKNGVLKISDLQNQIFHGEKRFPSAKVMNYVNLMSKFEVAIKISDKFLLIPSLLPDKQKECPVVCEIESPELRKAMNIHAYMNHEVYRRQYLMSYVPSGFWARLLTRLIADDRICKIVSSCCIIHGCGDLDSDQARIDAETLMRAAPPEWACWKTGIELSCFGTKLLRVCQLECDEPFYGGKETKAGVFVKSVNNYDGIQMVPVEILAPNVMLTIEKFIQYRQKEDGEEENLVGFRVIGINEVSSKSACELLVITVEHIDSLFSEWFPKIDEYVNIQGNRAVQRVSFCDQCLRHTIQKTEKKSRTYSTLQEPNCLENVESVAHVSGNEPNIFIPDPVSAGRTESTESAESADVNENGSDSNDEIDDGCEAFEDIEGLTDEEIELLMEYRQNAKGCIIAFELEEASKLLRKNMPLICPFHGKVEFGRIFPDLSFKDLDQRYILQPSEFIKGDFLADGAFGDIFKVEINRDDAIFEAAMKVPKEKEKEVMATLFSYNTYRNIRQEISILLTITHPHIIAFIGISLSPFALLLELAPYGSLDKCYMKYRRKGKKINPHVIQKSLQQISSGLKYLHRHHIIYRDLKCENILVWKFPDTNVHDTVNYQVTLKLTDYGISRPVSLSGAKGFHGTPGYMAPEILRYTGKESYTAKVDCFSFGSLIYELLALQQPFRDLARNKANLAQQYMLEGRRPKLKSAEKKFPVLMLSLLYRCWAQNHEDRPSATEINNLTSLQEFPKIVDILGLEESFKFQCVVTTNQSQCAYNVTDSRSVIGSHLWFCGYSGSGDSIATRNQGGVITVSSYHENKYCHVMNIKINDRILMVCAVGSTIWLGTECGAIQVFCALQFKPLALGLLHCNRYILRIIHSTVCHSVFVALDDGSVFSYPDSLSNYNNKIQETDVLKYFLTSTSSTEIRELAPNKRFTADTEMHCLVGVTSHIEKRYSEETLTYKDSNGDAVAASSVSSNDSYMGSTPEISMETTYELWCGQGKGTILILDMSTLRKMSSLPVRGNDITDPTLKGFSVKFMEAARTFDSISHDKFANQNCENEADLQSQYIWIVVYPGTEVARWSIDRRCIENTFDASQHSPLHDLNSSKVSGRTKALKAPNAQISALVIVEDSMYVGTTFGCLIICDAISMTAYLSVRCYEEYIETIIPLRMIGGRNRDEAEKKLVLTCGRNCFDSWIRNVDKKKRIKRSELTMLTWTLM